MNEKDKPLVVSPLDAFQGQIEPTKVSIIYKLAVLLVAFVMVLLPLFYLSLIAAAGYGVFWHATQNIGIMSGGGGTLVKIIVYVGPLISGVALVTFMLKPIFARMPKATAQISVTREEEPVLFGFIDKICEQVRAPKPRRVDVDTQVNASASFRSGIWSMLGNDLVLTIGMPLAAGMTMRELGGVLAHEFGHFAQGAGMRLSYLVRTINGWFMRAVYERDQMDESLKKAAGSVDIRIGVMLYMAQACIWLTRRILWVLMQLGNAISAFLLQQMEFDADSYEAKFGGSKSFEACSRKLQQLGVASNIAIHDAIESWQSKRLPDDLSSYVGIKVQGLDEDILKAIEKSVSEGKTGWFDSHPCDNDRIAAARKITDDPVFQLDAPATELFTEFEELSKRVTLHYYREAQELELTKANLIPVHTLHSESLAQESAGTAIAEYFGGLNIFLNPIHLPSAAIMAIVPEDESLAALKASRELLESSKEQIQTGNTQHDVAFGRVATVGNGRHLIKAGFSIPANEFLMDASTVQAADIALSVEKDALQTAAIRQRQYREAAQTRLCSALRLANAKLGDSAATSAERDRLYALADAVGLFDAPTFGQLLQLKEKFDAFAMLIGEAMQGGEAEHLGAEIESLGTDVRRLAREIISKMNHVRYPFDHAGGEIMIGEHIQPDESGGNEVEVAYNIGNSLLNKLTSLYHRVIGELVLIAKEVEDSIETSAPESGDAPYPEVSLCPSPLLVG